MVTPALAVIGASVENSQALLANMSATIPKSQFLREIPFNGIQACQRTATGRGKVVIDYEHVDGVAKLRVWDTGDGMSPTDLHARIGALSVAARTSCNFGIGAKLALTRVSPHGVVYRTLRDGVAAMATWAEDPTTGDRGLAVLNADGATDLERAVVPIDPACLPADIRRAGHGTAVTILGTDARDDTTWTLRPDGSTSRRWLLESLNDRFASLPAGTEMRVVMRNVEKKNGALVDDVRSVVGTAKHLDNYTRGAGGSADPRLGVHGKVRIGGPVPATARWWILPEGKDTPSYMRIGGRVRVVVGGEIQATHRASHLNACGIWTKAARVEIHFEPDEAVDVRADVQRTGVTVDGEPLPVLEWCEEFKRAMPTAIRALLAGTVKERADTDFSDELARMNARFTTTRMVRRRGPRTDGVTHLGQSTEHGTRSPGRGTGTAGTRERLRRATDRLRRRPAGQDGEGLATLVELVPGTGRGARMATVPAPAQVPTTSWINETGLDDDPELGEYAARYIADDNHLVINAQGATYRRVLATFEAEFRDVPGAGPAIEAQVRRFLTRAMQDTVIGVRRDLPRSWEELVTPVALSVRMASIYDIDARLRQVFARKGWQQGVAVIDDLAESA